MIIKSRRKSVTRERVVLNTETAQPLFAIGGLYFAEPTLSDDIELGPPGNCSLPDSDMSSQSVIWPRRAP